MKEQAIRVPTRDTRPFKAGFQPKKSNKTETLKVGRGERGSVLNRLEIGKNFPTVSVGILAEDDQLDGIVSHR